MDDPKEILKMTLGFFEKNSIDFATSVDVMIQLIALAHVKRGEVYEDYYYNMREAVENSKSVFDAFEKSKNKNE